MMFALRYFIAAVITCLPTLCLAQGLLVDHRHDHQYRLPRPHIWPQPRIWPPPTRVPQPPQSYKIQEIQVQATVNDQLAKVQVSQSFVNTGSRPMEVSFIFPLPYDGAVDQMTFMVDGKEFPAELLSAKEARRIYEGHIRRNEDPALLEWMGTGMLKTSVFPVPPGAKRTVTLHYSQLCRKVAGLTEWLFPLSTAKYTSQPVERVTIDATITSEAAIKNLYSPTHALEVKRPTAKSARISCTLTNKIPTSDFRLMYDIGDQPVSAQVISYRPNRDQEGYFLMLVSPDIQPISQQPIPKTVVFVVDRSGSMSGPKIDQAKEALRFVLNNLREGDLFNIIAYDSRVESFRPELQRYDKQTRAESMAFVEGIYAGGSTNIDGALQAALSQLQDDERPSYIVFLTDGLPTAGERREPKIVDNVRKANKVRARVFSFGVGFDVNGRLLDKLSRASFGQSQYVLPNEDIEQHVAQLYQRINAPALVNVKIDWDLENYPAEKGLPVSRVYPQGTIDLFAGDQLVLVGRYKQPGVAKVTIRGSVQHEEQTFHFPAELVTHSADDSRVFVEKLWAVRRVGEIIDEIDLQGRNEELVSELVALATQHGILTPYTSFLADETTNIRDLAANRDQAGVKLRLLQEESGAEAFLQRRMKNSMQREEQAPSGGYGYASDLLDTDALSSAPARGPSQFGLQPLRTAGRSLGGLAGGARPIALPGAPGAEMEPEAAESANRKPTVLNVGTKTFFFRNDRWEDSALTQAQIDNCQKIKRYSKAFFDLQSRFGKPAAKYLAIEGNVIVLLGDEAFEY